jgi:hypothetical protein
MRSERVILQRAALVVAVLTAVVVFAGCSSVGPKDAWTNETGRVTGTVRSDTGAPLAEIEVWLWAELGTDGREVWYSTETNAEGWYELDGIEMATQHSYSTEYWVGVNRDSERTNPIHEGYGTWYSTITVPADDTYVCDVVIEHIDDGPDDPETYVED